MGKHQALPEDMITKKKNVLFVCQCGEYMLREDTPIALPFIYINLWNLYAWQHPAAWEMHPFLGALPLHIRPYRVHAPSLPGNFLRSLTFTYVQTI